MEVHIYYMYDRFDICARKVVYLLIFIFIDMLIIFLASCKLSRALCDKYGITADMWLINYFLDQ